MGLLLGIGIVALLIVGPVVVLVLLDAHTARNEPGFDFGCKEES